MNLLFFLLINLCACFYQGITGFGAALIAVPLSLLVLDKFTAVSSLAIIGLVLNAFLFRKIKQPVNPVILVPLCLASLIGMPIGIWILTNIPINGIKIIAGSLDILLILIIAFNKISLPRTKVLTAIAGLCSGLSQTSIGMAGPPVVMLLVGSGSAKNEMRKTLVAFFLWVSALSLPLFLISGTLTLSRGSFGFYAIPFVFLGAYLGDKMVEKIPQKTFQILALVTVCLTGLLGIYSGLSH